MKTMICAIVVTYNGMEWLDKCIRSLLCSTYSTDIVVVDNASSDQTVTFLKANYPHVKIFQNHRNLGFGGANNLALKYAYRKGYEYFFLLNQDAWVESKTIESLVCAHDSSREYGIISPIHLNKSGSDLQENFEYHVNKDTSSGFLNDYRQGVFNQIIYEVPYVNAAAWMISREALDKVGLFHPLFFHYGEDDNYVHRLHYAGMKMGIDPASIIYHDQLLKNRNSDKHDALSSFSRQLLIEFLNPNHKRNLIQKYLYALNGFKKRNRTNNTATLKEYFHIFRGMLVATQNHQLVYQNDLFGFSETEEN